MATATMQRIFDIENRIWRGSQMPPATREEVAQAFNDASALSEESLSPQETAILDDLIQSLARVQANIEVEESLAVPA